MRPSSIPEDVQRTEDVNAMVTAHDAQAPDQRRITRRLIVEYSPEILLLREGNADVKFAGNVII
jgi:hypothetical protein